MRASQLRDSVTAKSRRRLTSILGAAAPREESLTCYPCLRNSHTGSGLAARTGIRAESNEPKASLIEASGSQPVETKTAKRFWLTVLDDFRHWLIQSS